MILLIWEEVPENLKLFEVEEESELGKHILQIAGLYVNASEMTPALEYVNEHLGDLVPIYNLEKKSEAVVRPSHHYSHIIVAGFIL